MTDGFLSRWAQRKTDVAASKRVAEPAAVPVTNISQAALPLTPVTPVTPVANVSVASLQTAPPTLADVQTLTKESDYSAFVGKGVESVVKNAAMKKLFSDPHFNVMDGLDIYIDDYNTPIPLAESDLRQMSAAKFLGLFDEPKEDTTANQTAPVALTPTATQTPDADDHTDLQLQRDHALGGDGAAQDSGTAAITDLPDPLPSPSPAVPA